MATEATNLFKLPKTKVIEYVVVQLRDMTIVQRTPDQLAALPPGELLPAIAAPRPR